MDREPLAIAEHAERLINDSRPRLPGALHVARDRREGTGEVLGADDGEQVALAARARLVRLKPGRRVLHVGAVRPRGAQVRSGVAGHLQGRARGVPVGHFVGIKKIGPGQRGVDQHFFPAVQGTIKCWTVVEQRNPVGPTGGATPGADGDPGDVLADTTAGLYTNGDGDVNDTTLFMERTLAAPDGAENK